MWEHRWPPWTTTLNPSSFHSFKVKCVWWRSDMLFSLFQTWFFWNILSLPFFGCVGQKFSDFCHFDISLLILGWSFLCDFNSWVSHNTFKFSLREYESWFKEKYVGSSWWKAKHLTFECFVYLFAYSIHGVPVPFSGGNMCVITFLYISEILCGSFAHNYNFLLNSF